MPIAEQSIERYCAMASLLPRACGAIAIATVIVVLPTNSATTSVIPGSFLPARCGLVYFFRNGNQVTVDFDTGVITNLTKNETYKAEPCPEFVKNIIAAEGLLNSLKKA